MSDDKVVKMIAERFVRIRPDTGTTDNVVFWIDPEGEFLDTVDSLELQDVTLIKWDGFNSFKIKEMIECENQESKYIIYRAGSVQSDQCNILADTMHYSKPIFSADSASCICQEVGLSEEYRGLVQRHLKFFKDPGNRTKFQKFHPSNVESVKMAMMAVTVGSQDDSLDGIVTKIISNCSGLSDDRNPDEQMEKLDRYELVDDFWKFCEKRYGFSDISLDKLVRNLFITAAFGLTEVSESPKLCKFILPDKNRACVVVDNILNNQNNVLNSESLCDSLSEKYGIKKILEAFDDLESLMKCDVFSCVDAVIAERLIGRILSTNSPLDAAGYACIDERLKTHSGRRLRATYDSITSASRLIDSCVEYKKRPKAVNAKAIIDAYVSDLFHIDTYYRHFIVSSDSINPEFGIADDAIDGLKQYVENTYCNVFLDPIVSELCSVVTKYEDFPPPSQQNFCNKYIGSCDKGLDRKTVVIISDAFRYECAAELCERFKSDPKFRVCELNHMISTVPSMTKFGMAALLPNNGLEIKLNDDGKFAVFLDGEFTESSGARETILQSHYPDSIVLKSDQIIIGGRGKEYREMCKGKKLIYIYHNSIDEIGESAEQNVFEACQKAIDEIGKTIKTVTAWNYTRFIVTSDHGFLYHRSEMKEYAKISTMEGFNSGRRFAINDRAFGLDRCVEFSLEYLGECNKGLFVSVPDSASIFRRQGKVKCFAHEGISPQEVVIPVLEVNTIKAAVEEKHVGLRPSNKRDIKQVNPKFDFYQDHPVNDEFHRCEYEVWLEDKDCQPLTKRYIVIADRDDPADLGISLKMDVQLQTEDVTLVIYEKGEKDEQRYEDFKVKIIGFL